MDNCIVVNNLYYKGIADNERLSPGDFEISENKVIKKGEIIIKLTGTDEMPFLDEVDRPLSVDYMHIPTGSLGYDLGAGLFID